MKKQYIQPVLEAIEMKYTTTLMAGSDVIDFGGTGDAGDALAPLLEDDFVFEEETFEFEDEESFEF